MNNDGVPCCDAVVVGVGVVAVVLMLEDDEQMHAGGIDCAVVIVIVVMGAVVLGACVDADEMRVVDEVDDEVGEGEAVGVVSKTITTWLVMLLRVGKRY